MAVALYSTMLVQPGQVEAIKRYLYDATEIVATVMVTHSHRDLCFLVLRTEAVDQGRTESLQQYQCDRLASGMYGMTIGLESFHGAKQHAANRAADNDWGLADWFPGSALVSA